MKLKERTVVILFIAILIFPTILFFILNPFLELKNVENRVLAKKPNISITTLSEYPKDYELYYNDNAPFRNYFVKAKSFIDYSIFHTPLSNKVIRGRGNWLFYEDTLADYKGEIMYTTEQLEIIRDNLIQMQSWLSEKGIEFYLFIAPNKATVYPEFMPSYIKTEGVGNKVIQLVEYLRLNTDIPVVFPLEDLLLAKEEYPIYYETDTHWNSLGGFIGTQSLMEAIGQNKKPLDEISVSIKHSKGHDLSNMIYLSDIISDTNNITVNGYNHISDEFISEDGHYRRITTNANNKTMFMIRDSYSDAMVKFLTPKFGKSIFMHRDYFDVVKIEEDKPDIVVFQVVERYIYTLLNFKVPSDKN